MKNDDIMLLAVEFAELAAALHEDTAPETQLHRIGDLAVKHVPGCTWASISDLNGGKGKSLAASDPIAARLDHMQYVLAEGPCVHSAVTKSSVLCHDLRAESRWPRFVAQACHETPARAILAIQLPGRDQAAMNFYANQPEVFDESAVAAAGILAAHATGLVAVGESAIHNQNLTAALDSNRKIGMAMGILMALHRVTQDDAFKMLRVASQELHRKLRDVASEVTETGALPESVTGGRAVGDRIS